MLTLRHPALALLLALTCAGCAASSHEPQPGGAATRPVAQVIGDLDATATKMRVAVDIAGLQPPGDLVPDATAFVVWYREDGDRPWERLGSLAYDPATQHAALPGVMVDGTSFELIVTAEAERTPAAPSPWVLFAQAVKA